MKVQSARCTVYSKRVGPNHECNAFCEFFAEYNSTLDPRDWTQVRDNTGAQNMKYIEIIQVRQEKSARKIKGKSRIKRSEFSPMLFFAELSI